eukprot:CAMPEP_0206374798 /NCGR_PEP_ID=MMETSP0294-20121207/8514_1 /ASSEMBLY_ACC=CAM_ASM_000327 /TAXON_ID=39354 /ORGANISM="Heterosigma akashiwo, Strain CCMP2393" /LENGTH=210 /DNA_ID=CAMNT_0053822627 /DNA_START=168 /DNA_END=797 /DNA_ORIENTATION=-
MHRARVGKERMPNRILHDKDVARTFELHKKKMDSIKGRKFGTGTVDSTEPQTSNLTHLRNNEKRMKMRADRFQDIERENKLLLQRMTKILTAEDNGLAAARTWTPKSLNSVARKQDLRRINRENAALLARLEGTQPYYDHQAWEDDLVHHKRLVGRLRKVRYEGSSSQLLPAALHDIEALDAASQRSLQRVRRALTAAGTGRPVAEDGGA